MIPIYPSRKTQRGIIHLADQLGLSELYAYQYAGNLGLYQLKAIDRETYEENLREFSKPLVQETPAKPLSLEEQQAKQKQDELTRHFAQVKTQWDLHKDNLQWVEQTVSYARKNLEVPGAEEIVKLGEASLQNRVLQSQVKVTKQGGVSN